MTENKPSGIIYIEPSRLLFYSASVNKVLFQDFPPDTVSDLDIQNKDKFTQILNFFIQNALQKTQYELTLVFSQQNTFEKVLIPTLSKDIDVLFSEFTSLVPFEEVLSRIYKENKSVKAYAVNKTFYELLADCFAKSGSTINLVLPVSIIVEKSPELSKNLDLPTIATKVESLKAYNMVEYYSLSSSDQSQQSEPGKNKNKRTYMLLGVFAILLVIMLIFAYSTFSAKPKVNKLPVKTKPVPTVQKENITQPSPTLSATPSSTFNQPTATKSPSL